MTDIHRCMIVPAHHQALAQMICAALAGPPGAGMFIAQAVSANTGAIFYASNGGIEDQFSELLVNPDALFAACQAAAVPVTLKQCRALLAESDVSDEPWPDAFARLGLIKKES